MLGKARGLLVATILGTLGLTGRGAAQGILPPPAPVPVVTQPVPVSPPVTPPLITPGPGPLISRPQPLVSQPVPVPPPGNFGPPVTPPPATPQPLFPPPPPGPQPGTYCCPEREPYYFFNYELAFLSTSLSNHLSRTITLPNGTTKTISLPGVGLDFAIAPKFEFGYRLPDHLGEFSIGYRFLITEGKEAQNVLGTETDLRSRFNFNEFDFDYATERYEVEPQWWLQTRIGARVNWSFFDTRSSNPIVADRESNYFVGAGPHLAFDLERRIINGFGFFAKVDGAVLIGQVDQHFTDSEAGLFTVSNDPMRKTVAVPTLQAQVGISYTPPRMEWLRFRVGYQYEHWFNLGSVEGSHLDLTTQGGFLRGEIDF